VEEEDGGSAIMVSGIRSVEDGPSEGVSGVGFSSPSSKVLPAGPQTLPGEH